MKVWKIVSGVLSIALSLFVTAQAVFAGLLDILISSGHSSGMAGIVVALMLLTGGIVSIASSDGSMGADTALISLYGVGALVGFALAGGFLDLIVWALWCVLCAVLALVDFLLIYRRGGEDGQEDEDEEAGEEPSASVRPPSLRSVILEKDPKRRDAAIDALPERAAKDYLKRVIDAFVRHQPIPPDRTAGRRALPAVLAVGGIVLLAVLLSWMLWGRGGEQEDPSAPSAAASQSAEPTAQPSPASAVPTAGPVVAEGALGDYQVELKGAFLTRDHEGKAAVVITYTWTNHSERTMNAMSAFVEKAFQNGVQIDSALIMPQPGYDQGAPMRDLRPGASTDVQRAFLLDDRTSPVEFEVSLFTSLSEEAVSALYDLEELVSVQ